MHPDPQPWVSVPDDGMYARKYGWCQLWFNCLRETIDEASASIRSMYGVADPATVHSDPDPTLEKKTRSNIQENLDPTLEKQPGSAPT